jgi:hypothetical protein
VDAEHHRSPCRHVDGDPGAAPTEAADDGNARDAWKPARRTRTTIQSPGTGSTVRVRIIKGHQVPHDELVRGPSTGVSIDRTFAVHHSCRRDSAR